MSEGQTTKLHNWLSRLRDGDEQALNEILDHFQQRLTLLAHKMLMSYPKVHAAEETGDVLQNASLRLTRALRELAGRPEFSGSSDPATRPSWHVADFFRLAGLQIRRELLDLARRYQGGRGAMVTGAAGDSGSSNETVLYQLAAESTGDPKRMASWAEFHEAVAALPDKPREVFDLLWYQGLTQAEAAEILTVDVRTIKSRWQAARFHVNDRLEGQMPGA